MESVIEMAKLVGMMIFISSLGAQGWIAFLDIAIVFTKFLEKFRPAPSQDKVTRVAVIIGVFVLIANDIVSLNITYSGY